MKTKYFDERMKLADLIVVNHNLILLLPRFGMPLGFGDRTVRDVCGEHGVSATLFLMICNVSTFSDYSPSTEQLAQTDMSMLVPYLRASHRYYMDNRIPHIGRHLSRVADSLPNRVGDVLRNFYNDYSQEIATHFRCEEEEVFPYLEALRGGQPPVAGGMGRFAESHESIEDKLSDLMQIVYKYLPAGATTDEVFALVFDLLQLSSDLEKHTSVEEHVLMPYMAFLERSRQ
ncbi:MAG: hemerythrin domain-containing protein [Bacteroidales bacterium]|nr:hemerythrin domain-containing protein [Bacteroidales bacterium]